MAVTYFLVRGIEPVDLKLYPDNVKLAYWGWIAELGIKAKDAELAKGLDKDGKPLRPIKSKTAKHRRSAMTPSGKGDPSAPPLMPGRSLSRVRSLLTARARKNAAEFYWRFDPWTHDTFGKILRYQADKGRDVFGLSPKATAKVQAQALVRWNAWKRKHVDEPYKQIVAMPPLTPKVLPFVPKPTARAVPVTGSVDTRFVTFGEGQTAESFAKSVAEGRNSGFMTHDQLVRHYRASIAKPRFQAGASPAARKGADRLHPRTGAIPGTTNRVLTGTFGTIKGRTIPFTQPIVPPTPKPLSPAKLSPIKQAEQELGVKFTPHPAAKGHPGYKTVVVDVAKAEASLAKDDSYHVGSGGAGRSAKPGGYERFLEFFRKAQATGEPIEQPRASVDSDGEFSLGDGRHRFAVLRDLGAKLLPVSVVKSVAAKVKRLFGWRE